MTEVAMRYDVYKLEFTTPVHFGMGSLSDAGISFCADTLFSGLYLEALKGGMQEEFYQRVKEGAILLSDAFPYKGQEYYLPKPMVYIEPKDAGDSVQKKKYKKMKYIPVSALSCYLRGDTLPDSLTLDDLGSEWGQVMTAVKPDEDAMPYVVGNYRFSKGCGLYCIVACKTERDKTLVDRLMADLSYAGIGGKRGSGKGKFELKYGGHKDKLLELLEKGDTGRNMLLSTALPREEELAAALEDSAYLLQKRAGFVFSETYAPEQRKKKDLYTMQAGSCFKMRFQGDIYDVGMGGAHPVYRYARAMFAGI